MAEVLWFRCREDSGYRPFSLDECTYRRPVRPRVYCWRRVNPGDVDYPDEQTLRSTGWRTDSDGVAWERLSDSAEDSDPSHWREYIFTCEGSWIRCEPA